MSPEVAFQLAMSHRQAGRLPEAEAFLRQVAAAAPHFADAWLQLGLVVLSAGRASEAVDFIARAIAIHPDRAAYHSDQAVAYTYSGRPEPAIAAFQRALSLQPDLAYAHRNLADTFQRLERYDEAIASYQRALALAPGDAGAHNNLGNAMLKLGRLSEAAACYGRAAQLAPNLVVAHSNLGDILTKLGNPDEGIACARRVLALNPQFAEGYLNLGVAFWHKRAFGEAENCFRQAIALRPDFADAHLSLAVVLLLVGRLEEGWHEYEWRWRSSSHGKSARRFSQPNWDGKLVPGQRLLIHAEQGFGDTLHFARYLPLVVEQSQAALVIFESQKPLQPLLAQLSGPKLEIVARSTDESLPPFDLHLPLFSLPLKLDRYEPILMDAPYLHADPERRARWRERLGSEEGLRVGISWAGNPTNENDRRRLMTLEALDPLLRVPGVHFVSLQVQARGPVPANVADFTAEISDFSDTAALMAELDLIITVDTAAAHLAGALGRPVWVLLPFVPDWRWGLEGGKTPLYPTMTLFRQSRAGEWGDVVERILDALRSFKC